MSKAREQLAAALRVSKGTTRVGDVEVTTAIVVPTPELDKLSAIKDRSAECGAFLDWLLHEKRYGLTDEDDQPLHRSINALLAEYFEIDEDKCEAERRTLLEAIRR